MSDSTTSKGIWFVYDGECPLCASAATAFRVKQRYGNLNLINAREDTDHELIQQINARGLDLDEGMIIFDGESYYHGKEALSFMARFGANSGAINIFTKAFYWSKSLTNISYPWLRGIRNLMLRRKKVARIDNLNLKSEPIFKSVFGDDWSALPAVMRKHYANRPYTKDVNIVEGTLDVMCAGPIKLLAPLFWLIGTVPPMTEKNVPVTVRFESNKDNKEFVFNRIFHFKDRKPYRFKSRLVQTNANEMVEIMPFGLGWRMHCLWENDRVKLQHRGYALCIFGHFLPLPLTWLIGAGNAEETAIDENSFSMWVDITHPRWGKIYQYKGCFKVKE